MKRVFAMSALGWLVTSVDAFCQSFTTITYDAVVVDSTFGPNKDAFSPGDQVVISYTLDPGISDSDSDPNIGRYFGAVRALSVSFPGLGISAVAGTGGFAAVFNNFVADPSTGALQDGVNFFGGAIASTTLLGGLPITRLEVDFGSDRFLPPTEPTMLSSDALPLLRLFEASGASSVMLLRTSAGTSSTFVRFRINRTAAEQVSSLLTSIESLVSRGALKSGQANGLMRPLDNALRSLAGGHVASVCSQILDFEAAVNEKLLDGALSSSDAAALIAAAENIRSDLNCL